MAEKVTLDHVAIAVSSIAQSLPLYRAAGCIVGEKETVTEQDVMTQFLETGEGRIELLEPLSDKGPVGKFLKSKGPGIHHICLRVKDIHASLAEMKKSGYQLIHETPVKGAGNCLVAFVHPKATGGVLLELKQKL